MKEACVRSQKRYDGADLSRFTPSVHGNSKGLAYQPSARLGISVELGQLARALYVTGTHCIDPHALLRICERHAARETDYAVLGNRVSG